MFYKRKGDKARKTGEKVHLGARDPSLFRVQEKIFKKIFTTLLSGYILKTLKKRSDKFMNKTTKAGLIFTVVHTVFFLNLALDLSFLS
ncbi:hypothetical protein [Siminovitchia fortis]|nr:hypothetical protein [Siminovitchia fortis]